MVCYRRICRLGRLSSRIAFTLATGFILLEQSTALRKKKGCEQMTVKHPLRPLLNNEQLILETVVERFNCNLALTAIILSSREITIRHAG